MKVVATILALLIVLSSIICVAKSGNTRVCGSRLIKQVIHICNGCIAGTFVEEVEKRRASSFGLLMSRVGLQGASKNLPDWYKGRGKRGIVEECCYSQCSYSALKKYCCRKHSSNDVQRKF